MHHFVQARITGVSKLGYADITVIDLEAQNVRVKIEVPTKVLEEIRWSPSVNDEISIEICKELGDISNWNIVMQGEIYFKREETRKIIASFGGLQVAIESNELYPEYNVGDRVYLKLRSTK